MNDEAKLVDKPASRSLRKGAKEMLRIGQKSLSYRKDLLDLEQAEELESRLASLNESIRDKSATTKQLEDKARAADEILQERGGDFYNQKSWVENVEMLLVAAIIVIGIRSFFIQPFIIPTNSMYPTYFGMQPYVYE